MDCIGIESEVRHLKCRLHIRQALCDLRRDSLDTAQWKINNANDNEYLLKIIENVLMDYDWPAMVVTNIFVE